VLFTSALTLHDAQSRERQVLLRARHSIDFDRCAGDTLHFTTTSRSDVT
jgi:hypothetical protein